MSFYLFFYFKVDADEAARFETELAAERWIAQQGITGVLVRVLIDYPTRYHAVWYSRGRRSGS